MDIEAILNAESDEQIKELKIALFRERIRLEEEKRDVEEAKDKLIKERVQFRDEMDMLNHRIVIEQKRIKDDKILFDKKLQILQNAFKQLDVDRSRFAREKQRFELERELWEDESAYAGMEDVVEVLFRNVGNPLALRKRYKDLLKIFHPDNLCGDAELVQALNREYEKRRKAE